MTQTASPLHLDRFAPLNWHDVALILLAHYMALYWHIIWRALQEQNLC